MTFALNGFTTASVTPWVTSANLNLFRVNLYSGRKLIQCDAPGIERYHLRFVRTASDSNADANANAHTDADSDPCSRHGYIDIEFVGGRISRRRAVFCHDRRRFPDDASHGDGAAQCGAESGVLLHAGNWGAALHTIGITFLNDAYGGTPQLDRNLYANSISYDGVLYPSPQTLLRTGDAATFTTDETTAPPTPIPTPSPIPAPPVTDTLTLNLSEDAFQGDAQLSATIDGVFLTTSHGDGATRFGAESSVHLHGQLGRWAAHDKHHILERRLWRNVAVGSQPVREFDFIRRGVIRASPQVLLRTGDAATFTTH